MRACGAGFMFRRSVADGGGRMNGEEAQGAPTGERGSRGTAILVWRTTSWWGWRCAACWSNWVRGDRAAGAGAEAEALARARSTTLP